jgi:tetratricopeptide (TPR) repeat protein
MKNPLKAVALTIPAVSERMLLIVVAVFSFLLYANTLNHDYNLDDELVTRNHRLTGKGISAIPEIFTSPYYQDEMGYKYEYRPVVLTSFAIEHSLFGENPAISHLINVLLYVVTLWLLFNLLLKLFPGMNVIFPWVVCMMFAAHPLHTEVVANIKNRDEILALLFGLAAWIWSINYANSLVKNFLYLLLVVCCYTLSILSKQSVVSFAFLIPLSLVMFFDAGKIKLLLLSVLLSFITVLIIPLNMIAHKALLFLFIAITPILIQLELTEKILSKTKSLFLGYFTTHDNQEPADPVKFFVKFNFSNPQAFIIVFLTIAMLALGIAYAWTSLVYFSFIFGFAFSIINNNKSLANRLLVVNLLTAVVLNDWHNNAGAYDLFLLYLFFITILSKDSFSKPYLYASYAIVFLYAIFRMDQLFIPYAIFFIVFLATKNVKSFIMLLVVSLIKLLASSGNILFSAYNNPAEESILYEELFSSVCSTIVLILFFFRPTKKMAYYALIAAVIGLFTYYFYYHAPAFLHSTDKLDLNVSANILPESDRPILFLEMPLRFDSPLNEKIGTAAYVLAEYLKLMVIPHPMSFYYGYAVIVPVGISNIQSIISIILHLILLIVALALIRKAPILSFGIIFYLVSIVIFSNLLHPVVGMMADRFTYVASIGFCISIAYLLLKLFRVNFSEKTPVILKPVFILVMVLLLGVYSFLTIARNAQWKNHLTLMRHDIKHLDKSAQAHNLLAQNIMKYSQQKAYSRDAYNMYQEALIHFRRSAEIYPYFLNVWFDMGRLYLMLNDKENAFRCFMEAHNLDSTFTTATLNIARIAQEKKDFGNAIKYYEKLIRNNPNSAEAFSNLSYMYYQLGYLEKSIEVNKKAIEIFPDYWEAYQNIALVYTELNDTANAYFYQKEAQKRKK